MTTQAPVSRRGVLTAAGGSGVALAVGVGTAGTAAAAPPRVRHFLNRFTGGYTRADARAVAARGGPEGWLEWQLHPGRIEDPWRRRIVGWYPNLDRSPREQFRRQESISGYGFATASDHGRLAMMLRAYSSRQLLETMVEFWSNHVYVYSMGGRAWMWRSAYDAAVRRHALGRFDDLLVDTVTSGSMLAFLDADESVVVRRRRGDGSVVTTERLNENLGRELLELHTVGAGSGYTEEMVRDSARILTGWRLDRTGSQKRYYDPASHYTGPVAVLGFSDPNGDRDGRAVCRSYLRYLARHPATAQRIARKLAVRFVSDAPPQPLVDDLAQAFLDHDTAIAPVLRALVRHPLFYDAATAKVRTPVEDVVATMRALGVRPRRPGRSESSFANSVTFLANAVGQAPFMWPTPDGYPDQGPAWASSGRVMGSWRMHYLLASGYWPTQRVRYRLGADWLPRRRIRFAALVDHLAQRLLGTPADPALVEAACLAMGVTKGEVITRDHRVARWQMGRLLGLLLDSYDHLHR